MKNSTAVGRRKSQIVLSPETAQELLSLRIFWVIAAVLVASVFAVYSPTLDFQFILDDHRFLGDPRVQTSGHVWEYFTHYVWAQTIGGPPSFYRPVFVLWMRINFIFNEMSPWGWHFFSIGKHVLVAVLLGLLVWKLLHDRIAVLIAATLFALHPSHTESVAWVTVPDPLMACAILASVLLYLKYKHYFSNEPEPVKGKTGTKSRKAKTGKGEGPSVGWLIASAGMCFAALLTKETSVILPAIFFVLMVWIPIGKAGISSGENKTRATAFGIRVIAACRQSIPFLCATILYFALRLNALHGKLGALTQHLPLRTVLLFVPSMLSFYTKALFLPVRSYAFGNTDDIGIFSVDGLLLPAFIVLFIAALLAWLLFWTWRRAMRQLHYAEVSRVEFALLLGVFLMVAPILLALNLNALNPGDFLHGRYVYLSSIGLALVLATAWHVATSHRPVLLLVAGFVAVAFAVLTISQEGMWRDDLTIFTVGNEIAPHNKVVALNRSRARVQDALKLIDLGRCSEGMPVFEDATQQFPDDWIGWAALGDCYDQLRDFPQAELNLRRAAELAHRPEVTEQWQHVRAEIESLNSGSPAK